MTSQPLGPHQPLSVLVRLWIIIQLSNKVTITPYHVCKYDAMLRGIYDQPSRMKRCSFTLSSPPCMGCPTPNETVYWFKSRQIYSTHYKRCMSSSKLTN